MCLLAGTTSAVTESVLPASTAYTHTHTHRKHRQTRTLFSLGPFKNCDTHQSVISCDDYKMKVLPLGMLTTALMT